MAILDFFNKGKKDEVIDSPPAFAPKSEVLRGPGGKFISKKKVTTKKEAKKDVEKEPEMDTNKIRGPFMAPFAGKEIRKFYTNKRWYFAIDDLIYLLSSDPSLKPIEELKVDPRFKDLFEKKIKVIEGIGCMSCKGASETLQSIVKAYNATFPGSLFRWLEDISSQEFVEIKNNEEKEN